MNPSERFVNTLTLRQRRLLYALLTVGPGVQEMIAALDKAREDRENYVKQLLEEKIARSKKVFPNAVYMPGDSPPIGKKLLRPSGISGMIEVEVLREYHSDDEGDDHFLFWWLIKVPGYSDPVMEWPPRLMPLSG